MDKKKLQKLIQSSVLSGALIVSGSAFSTDVTPETLKVSPKGQSAVDGVEIALLKGEGNCGEGGCGEGKCSGKKTDEEHPSDDSSGDEGSDS